jgi:hypothetical protein
MQTVQGKKMRDGSVLVFRGTNWKLAGDSKWAAHGTSYVANGNEKYVGSRKIGGVEHEVFVLCDDDFGAQPKEQPAA